MEELQGKLEELLMTIVQRFDVPPMELLKFVEYPFTVSISTAVQLVCYYEVYLYVCMFVVLL